MWTKQTETNTTLTLIFWRERQLENYYRMDARLNKLIQAFEAKGWAFMGSVDVSSDWWFQDILQLVSTWRPTGVNIYLTLLTDPLILDKKVVWCISISTIIPDNRNFTYLDQLTLNDIKKTDLNLFVERINNYILTISS